MDMDRYSEKYKNMHGKDMISFRININYSGEGIQKVYQECHLIRPVSMPLYFFLFKNKTMAIYQQFKKLSFCVGY